MYSDLQIGLGLVWLDGYTDAFFKEHVCYVSLEAFSEEDVYFPLVCVRIVCAPS